MVDRKGALRRRGVLAGMAGATAALGAPAILRAAPSGQPVRVGGTLSLTGFLAQTAVIHKISAEMMVEEINKRNGLLGRPEILRQLFDAAPNLVRGFGGRLPDVSWQFGDRADRLLRWRHRLTSREAVIVRP